MVKPTVFKINLNTVKTIRGTIAFRFWVYRQFKSKIPCCTFNPFSYTGFDIKEGILIVSPDDRYNDVNFKYYPTIISYIYYTNPWLFDKLKGYLCL